MWMKENTETATTIVVKVNAITQFSGIKIFQYILSDHNNCKRPCDYAITRPSNWLWLNFGITMFLMTQPGSFQVRVVYKVYRKCAYNFFQYFYSGRLISRGISETNRPQYCNRARVSLFHIAYTHCTLIEKRFYTQALASLQTESRVKLYTERKFNCIHKIEFTHSIFIRTREA